MNESTKTPSIWYFLTYDFLDVFHSFVNKQATVFMKIVFLLE